MLPLQQNRGQIFHFKLKEKETWSLQVYFVVTQLYPWPRAVCQFTHMHKFQTQFSNYKWINLMNPNSLILNVEFSWKFCFCGRYFRPWNCSWLSSNSNSLKNNTQHQRYMLTFPRNCHFLLSWVSRKSFMYFNAYDVNEPDFPFH